MKGLWLYLHFPLLALESQSDAAERPAALLDERAAQVVQVNALAQADGVVPGMAMASALSLVPRLRMLQACPARHQAQLEGLGLWSGRFSARVSLRPPDGVLLEVGSMLRYFRGLEGLRTLLRHQLEKLGLTCVTATGHTPRAARLLALDGGFWAEDEGPHLQRLTQVPLSRLDLEARQQSRLKGLGLATLGQLQALPQTEIVHRLGKELGDQLARISGQQADPPEYFVPPEVFCRAITLSHEIERAPALIFPLRRLLVELEGFLHARCRRALKLELCLGHPQGQQQLDIGHAVGEQQADAWLELCRLRLEGLQLSQPVISLRLIVSELKELERGGEDLFSAPAPRDTPGQLLSRLVSRLGDGAVSRLVCREDYRPECSWQRLPATGRWPEIVELPATRPGWLLETPQPVEPAQIATTIALVEGPERVAGGWWDLAPVRRDYYVGRWPDGRCGWVFRDAQGEWFVHGWFG
ncbi:Y-family DNA polymerase [Halomonas huangheensis]|uniref:UmuC domain-containing protein n=1 Tax=Halomonas huangheensis TaxID=1178482 RepID=W1ND77_9GAMM|nr:DNA polymerase Y family protein [Halomonas huangheensis]ALM53009.1 hypothetical protein AR456_12470 [Halomonas huangheensis]ERL53060.1 hypothetical protein BJB45_17440 [Halomonas huangheensis]